MSHTDVSQQEQRDRQGRLWVIVGIAALVFVATSAVLLVGNRQVGSQVDDIQRAAATANVDPTSIALYAVGDEPDPVAQALDVDTFDVSLQKLDDNRWCVKVVASALLSSESVFFIVERDGRLAESTNCGA